MNVLYARINTPVVPFPFVYAEPEIIGTVNGAHPDIDSRVMAVGDVVLLQANTNYSGVYRIVRLGSVSITPLWRRVEQCDSTFQYVGGQLVKVWDGNTYAHTLWELTTAPPISFGSSTIQFMIFNFINPYSFSVGTAGFDINWTNVLNAYTLNVPSTSFSIRGVVNLVDQWLGHGEKGVDALRIDSTLAPGEHYRLKRYEITQWGPAPGFGVDSLEIAGGENDKGWLYIPGAVYLHEGTMISSEGTPPDEFIGGLVWGGHNTTGSLTLSAMAPDGNGYPIRSSGFVYEDDTHWSALHRFYGAVEMLYFHALIADPDLLVVHGNVHAFDGGIFRHDGNDGVTGTLGAGATCSGGIITDLGSGGSVGDFTDLGDVPGSYAGAGGWFVMVTGAADGLEFVDPSTVILPPPSLSFLDLTDVPASYTAGFWVKVDAGGTGLEFVNPADMASVIDMSFLDLNDTPSDYTGFDNCLLRVESGGVVFNDTSSVDWPDPRGASLADTQDRLYEIAVILEALKCLNIT